MCDLPSYSKLLYDITSQDPSNPSELRVRKWIDQLNDALHCTLKFSKALASTLVQRANNLRYRMKNKGGRRRSEILSQNWTLTISFDEDNPSTPSSSSEVARLSQQVTSLQRKVEASARVLQQIQQETPQCRTRTAKHYSQRHERRIKKRRVEECATALSWMEKDGLTPVSVTVMNTRTNALETFSIRKDLERALNLNEEEIGEQEADVVSMMLYVKDRYNISGSAYHELASLCRQMPRHYRLKERIAELNSKWSIQPTPEGTVGVQQAFEERLRMCLERLVSILVLVCREITKSGTVLLLKSCFAFDVVFQTTNSL